MAMPGAASAEQTPDTCTRACASRGHAMKQVSVRIIAWSYHTSDHERARTSGWMAREPRRCRLQPMSREACLNSTVVGSLSRGAVWPWPCAEPRLRQRMSRAPGVKSRSGDVIQTDEIDICTPVLVCPAVARVALYCTVKVRPATPTGRASRAGGLRLRGSRRVGSWSCLVRRCVSQSACALAGAAAERRPAGERPPAALGRGVGGSCERATTRERRSSLSLDSGGQLLVRDRRGCSCNGQ